MMGPEGSRSTIDTASSFGEFPLFFTAGSQAIYGVLHSPDGDHDPNRVLVFCHSIGIEHMVAQRMEVLGARMATQCRFAAFRYDSRAHGDSSGDPRELTFGDLVDDACVAADYARKLSGATRVIWVGVRFGALIAAAAMARRNDTAALALWEPLHHGSDYFRAAIRTMLFCQLAQGKRSAVNIDDLLSRLEAVGVLPVVGTYLYSALWCSALNTDLGQSLKNWAGDTLIAQVQRKHTLATNHGGLRSELEQRGGKVSIALINQEPAWSMLPIVKPQWTSDALLMATKQWLYGLE